MKDSHQVLVVAGVLILIGIVLIGLSRSINIPSAYNPFLSARALFTMGFFFLGFGIGVVGTIGYVVKLERKISQTPPPPFSNTSSFCRYCGTQNTPNSVFCSKCGKKLT